MKTFYPFRWLLFLAIFSACFAATPVRKPTGKKTIVRTTTGKKPAGKTVNRTSGKSARYRKGKSLVAPSTASRSHQAIPSPERYKEIQEALTAKGYLKSEPSGVWDTQSADALKQFQNDNKLSPTGKLSSASLISLGLGPKISTDPIVLAPVPHP